MSKILDREKKRLSEKNSFHLSQSGANAVGAVNAAGLALASTKVITSTDEDLTFLFGRCGIGSQDTDSMMIAHRDRLTTVNFALKQTQSGITVLNCRSGTFITFRINNSEYMKLTTSLFRLNVPLQLSGAPTIDLHAATKKYVDDNVGGPIDSECVGAVMTRDGAWHDVDSSGTFSADKYMLFVDVYTVDAAEGEFVRLRPKGEAYLSVHYHNTFASKSCNSQLVVFTDSDCVWQYEAGAGLEAASYAIVGGIKV